MKRTRYKDSEVAERGKAFRGKVGKKAKEAVEQREKAKEAREQHKAKAKDFYNRLYDKSKEYEFQTDKEAMNNLLYFFCPHFGIESGVTKEAAAIYPVICSQANFNEMKPFQLPLKDVCTMSGHNEQLVKDAIKTLRSIPIRLDDDYSEFCMENEGYARQVIGADNRPRYIYFFNPWFLRGNTAKDWKTYFLFHDVIIESGVWAKLSLRAKAMYIALRQRAKQNDDLCYSLYPERKYYHLSAKKTINRPCDFYDGSISQLCELVGIGKSNLGEVWKQLEDNGLIDKIDHLIVVYLRPRHLLIMKENHNKRQGLD